jgi:hypothetical protein
MIKLSQPKAYGEIKPLHGSTGQPIRCTPPCIVVPDIEDWPDCTDGGDEYIACDVPCWPCHKPIEHVERTE